MVLQRTLSLIERRNGEGNNFKEPTMHPGYVTRGQGCCVGDRWGVIARLVTDVDGEQFVVVRFRGGEEQLVSALELLPASQAVDTFEADEADTEEKAFAEVEDGATSELEFVSLDRSTEIAKNEEDEEAIEAEEEFEFEGEET